MIIPAILEQTAQGFAEKFEQIKQLSEVKKIQVDFADGQFVGTTTVPVTELGTLDENYEWEAHLMIDRPVHFAEYKEAGFSTVIVHYESFSTEAHLEAALLSIDNLDMVPVIAINPETAVSVLRYDTDTIHRFTILSVQPGSQGGSFIPRTLERIAELRSMAPNATIEVDGGIKAENIQSVLEAGADDVAVGSALFETEDIKQNYSNLAGKLT